MKKIEFFVCYFGHFANFYNVMHSECTSELEFNFFALVCPQAYMYARCIYVGVCACLCKCLYAMLIKIYDYCFHIFHVVNI